MAYHDDLIEHAMFLAELDLPDEAKQVNLRHAVSAAYYGLFHLLTTEAAMNWKNEAQRNRFARMFDHGRMKTCCSRVSSRPLPDDPSEIQVATYLKLVADAFVELQQARHTADYDHSKVWSYTEAWEMIAKALDATVAWSGIRESEIAQDYLLDLMGARS
jgi:uncharacterized protein (UPF0332 family)